MATPNKSSIIFYPQQIEGLLLELHSFEPHKYIKIEGAIETTINMAYLDFIKPSEKNPLGPAALKSKALALGKLGYWAYGEIKREKPIGFLGSVEERVVVKEYIPRLIIEKHPSLGYVYLTPLKLEELLEQGMLPMNRPRKGKPSKMTRVEVQEVTGSFVIDSFIAYNNSEAKEWSLVQRFNAYHPWEGNFPQHGGPGRI